MASGNCSSNCPTRRFAMEPDDIAGDGRTEPETDAELLEYDGHRTSGPLDNRNGELAAGQEARFLTVVRHQVGFGETLEIPVRLERSDHHANPLCLRKEEQVQ